MSIFDIDNIKNKDKAMQHAADSAIAYATQGVAEFASAAQQVGTPLFRAPSGGNVFGFGDRKGVWVLMRDSNASNEWLSYAFGAAVAPSGNVYLGGRKSSIAKLGEDIAGKCGFDIDTIKEALEAALLGQPMCS